MMLVTVMVVAVVRVAGEGEVAGGRGRLERGHVGELDSFSDRLLLLL